MAEERPRIALVTGASSGIGAASVRTLAAAGLETIAAARRLERCEKLAREVGGRALALDVTDSESVAALADAVAEVDGSFTARAGRSGSTQSPRRMRGAGGRCTRAT